MASPVMAPREDRAKVPPTLFLGPSWMTEDLLKDLERRGVIARGKGIFKPHKYPF